MSEGTSSQQVTMEKGLKILLSCHENMQYNLHTLTRDQEKKKKKKRTAPKSRWNFHDLDSYKHITKYLLFSL